MKLDIKNENHQLIIGAVSKTRNIGTDDMDIEVIGNIYENPYLLKNLEE